MSITTTYDREADALLVRFGATKGMARTIVAQPGVHLDFDTQGRLVSLEVLGASTKITPAALAGLEDGTEWLLLSDAAALAQLSPVTLRVQINKGRITGEKRGRDWFIARHVLDTYLDEVEQRRGGRAAPIQAQERKTLTPVEPTTGKSYTLGYIRSPEPQMRGGKATPSKAARTLRAGGVMAQHGKALGRDAKFGAKALSGQKSSAEQAKSVAVSTQTANKGKKKGSN